MKTRNGFVSNSSSSSFIIPLSCVSNDQLDAIHNHEKIWKKLPQSIKNIYDMHWEDAWEIKKKGKYITGVTCMDNFNMKGFLEFINISPYHIDWDEGHFFDDDFSTDNLILKREDNDNK